VSGNGTEFRGVSYPAMQDARTGAVVASVTFVALRALRALRWMEATQQQAATHHASRSDTNVRRRPAGLGGNLRSSDKNNFALFIETW